MAHPAKIAFSFFPYVANEDNVRRELQLRSFQRGSNGQQSSDAGGIIADPRPKQPVSFLARFQPRSARENCIQMCAYAQAWRRLSALQHPKYVAQFIRVDCLQSQRSKAFVQPLAARSFPEWW